jgi:hypothetical protein
MYVLKFIYRFIVHTHTYIYFKTHNHKDLNYIYQIRKIIHIHPLYIKDMVITILRIIL